MQKPTRRILIVAGLLIAFISVSIGFLYWAEGRDVKSRSAQIVAGMPRDEVERLMGPPYLTLRSAKEGDGPLLVWIDQFWQVDVKLDGDNKVLYVNSRRSQSFYNNTIGRFLTPTP